MTQAATLVASQVATDDMIDPSEKEKGKGKENLSTHRTTQGVGAGRRPHPQPLHDIASFPVPQERQAESKGK